MSTLSLQKLKSFEQTVNYIKKNITEYWTDILLYPELLQLSPFQFFRFIQRCPYVADPKGIEFVTRPKILISVAGRCCDWMLATKECKTERPK